MKFINFILLLILVILLQQVVYRPDLIDTCVHLFNFHLRLLKIKYYVLSGEQEVRPIARTCWEIFAAVEDRVDADLREECLGGLPKVAAFLLHILRRQSVVHEYAAPETPLRPIKLTIELKLVQSCQVLPELHIFRDLIGRLLFPGLSSDLFRDELLNLKLDRLGVILFIWHRKSVFYVWLFLDEIGGFHLRQIVSHRRLIEVLIFDFNLCGF